MSADRLHRLIYTVNALSCSLGVDLDELVRDGYLEYGDLHEGRS